MGRTGTLIHASVETAAGNAVLRDLLPGDIAEIVRYWHESGEEHLRRMGADPALLGTRVDTELRFLRAIRAGDPGQQNVAFAVDLDGELAGYTLLNRYSAEINYSHWHILRPHQRGRGISTALYPHRIRLYFDLFPIERLVHQTRTTNVAINRLLDKFVPFAEVCHVSIPDGFAGPGDFNLRYVRREDIPGLFEKAAKLRADR